MAELEKSVLMIHLDEEQGELWQALLRSQGLEVLWETPDVELVELLKAAKQNNVSLPDLLLIDMGIKSPNSETLQSRSVCEWCSKNEPGLEVVLFNPKLDRIGTVERNFLLKKGAADVIPRLYQENLVQTITQVAALIGCTVLEEPLQQIANTKAESYLASQGLAGDHYKFGVTKSSTAGANKSSLKEGSVTEASAKSVEADRDTGRIYRGVRVKK